MPFLDRVYKSARARRATIILAEAEDARVLKAAKIIEEKGIARLLLAGREDRIRASLKRLKTSLKAGIINYDAYGRSEHLARELVLLRMRRGMTLPAAKKLLRDDSRYFAAMLVKTGVADGYVSGNQCTTAETIRPALQVIGAKDGFASSYFILRRHSGSREELLFFADCGFNVRPSPEELATIAVQTAKSALRFGVKPRVAFLSFSTHGSARHELVDRTRSALEFARARFRRSMLLRSVPLDGELQFDAAFVPEVARRKAPESPLNGRANLFIFPDLNSGNIAYKIAERLGGFQAIGPLLQGLKRPVNDLSRGCSVQDVVDVVAFTAEGVKR